MRDDGMMGGRRKGTKKLKARDLIEESEFDFSIRRTMTTSQ